MIIKKERVIILLGIILIFLGCSISLIYSYEHYYLGDYIIQKMWISSSYSQNQTYCNNCLWIEFYEGCNNYPVYFFALEHQINPDFKVGDVVNLNFNEIDEKFYIKNIQKAVVYRTKC